MIESPLVSHTVFTIGPIVARAKGEIFAGLDETGTAVINADDDFAPLWRELAGSHGQLSFGLRRPADVTAGWQATATGSHLVARTPAGELELVKPAQLDGDRFEIDPHHPAPVPGLLCGKLQPGAWCAAQI